MDMKRRMMTMAAVALVSMISLFAADTWESGTLYHTNTLVDGSDEYIATTRSVHIEYRNSNGEEIDESSATAYYTLKNHGSQIERQLSGDRDVFALLDTIYDGYVMTPFNDGIYSYDHDQLEDMDVDGVLCEVYRFEVAMDLNTLHAGRAMGELIGWDEEEGEENGDIVMTLYVDPSSGLIVRQDMHIELPGVSPEDVNIRVADNVLTISGEKKNEIREGVRVFVQERGYGTFSRALSLPEDADAERIRAFAKDGVLMVEIPRRKPEEVRTRTIEVQRG